MATLCARWAVLASLICSGSSCWDRWSARELVTGMAPDKTRELPAPEVTPGMGVALNLAYSARGFALSAGGSSARPAARPHTRHTSGDLTAPEVPRQSGRKPLLPGVRAGN